MQGLTSMGIPDVIMFSGIFNMLKYFTFMISICAIFLPWRQENFQTVNLIKFGLNLLTDYIRKNVHFNFCTQHSEVFCI